MLFNSISPQEPIKSIEVDGFTLTERLHQPNMTLQQHTHEVTIIGFVLKGSCVESVGGRSYECCPYSLQILPAGETHSYKFGRDRVHCITVEVLPRKLAGIRLFSDILDRPVYLSEGVLSAPLTRLYKEFRMGDGTSALTIEGLVLETLGDAAHYTRRTSSAEPDWLRQARDFIHGHFAEKVSLTALAAFTEVHPAHLARTFRKHYGCSVGSYVRRLRLDYAVRQLTTDKPLAEIAAAAGFYDQSHFTQAFKLEMKMTPAAYRSAARAKRR